MKYATIPLALFNTFGIRLKTNSFASSWAELKEQKGYVSSQVVIKEICKFYTRSVAYKPYCLFLMTKGVLKNHVLLIPEGVHSYYRNILWYRSDTDMIRYD